MFTLDIIAITLVWFNDNNCLIQSLVQRALMLLYSLFLLASCLISMTTHIHILCTTVCISSVVTVCIGMSHTTNRPTKQPTKLSNPLCCLRYEKKRNKSGLGDGHRIISIVSSLKPCIKQVK